MSPELKPQIRVLGLAASRGYGPNLSIIAGIVFRGSFWLEGAMTMRLTQNDDPLSRLSREIRGSKHFSQIRAILLDPSLKFLNSTKPLATRTGLPVLLFAGRIGRKMKVRYSGCEPAMANSIIQISTGEYQLPEAVRVARMLARALSGLRLDPLDSWD